VLPTAEDPTGKNVLGIDVDDSEARFRLNGETVLTIPRGELALDGIAGFRVGAGLNLHLTTLDLTTEAGTTHWAPQREAETDGGGDS
jgi:hypothetical protein